MQPIMTSSKERIGYPTQKPLKLLDRIIQASSRETPRTMRGVQINCFRLQPESGKGCYVITTGEGYQKTREVSQLSMRCGMPPLRRPDRTRRHGQ